MSTFNKPEIGCTIIDDDEVPNNTVKLKLTARNADVDTQNTDYVISF